MGSDQSAVHSSQLSTCIVQTVESRPALDLQMAQEQ